MEIENLVLIIVLLVAWSVLGFALCYNAGKSIGESNGYIKACEDIKKFIGGNQS